MGGMFEVIGYKNGKRAVFYYHVKALYNGIANRFHDVMKAKGYENINVRLVC